MNTFMIYSNRKSRAFIMLLFALLLCFSTTQSQAYNSPFTKDADQVWTLVQKQFEQQDSDTSFQFILPLVQNHCKQDAQCTYYVYEHLSKKLEAVFNLPAAIYVSYAMLDVARELKDVDKEGHVYFSLYRFHDARGNTALAARDVEMAIRLFEQSGNQRYVLLCKMCKLEESLDYKPFVEVYPAMNALLLEAEKQKETKTTLKFRTRLASLCRTQGLYKEAYKHIAALELLAPKSNPIKKEEYGYLILAPLERGELAVLEDDFPKAEAYFQKALKLAEAEPSYWLEIELLVSLAEVSLKTQKTSSAKSYLQKALKKAEGLKLDEFLMHIYGLKSEIAEKEGQFAAALDFKKEAIFFTERFESKSLGYDARAFNFELEKEKLETEKALQKSELELKTTQIKVFYAILLLALLFALFLGYSFQFQKNAKLKLAEKNLLIQKQSETLQNLDIAKSKFFANVSHELRTPLTLMLGPISSLLKENKLTDRQATLLNMANQSGEQLQYLVNKILDLSKMDAGKMEIYEEETPLASFFRRHIAQFDSMAERKQISFLFDIKINDTVTAAIDQAKYRQILSNLLSNALKFTPASGQVSTHISLSGNDLKIIVADTGQGIHPEDLPYLFERYFQTKQTKNTASGGTGIGLALCYEYAQLFKGKISAQNNLGKGARFELILPLTNLKSTVNLETQHAFSTTKVGQHIPLSENPAQQPSASGVAGILQTKAKTQKPKILVVEDNAELQKYLRIVLSDAYDVSIAEHGQVALNCLEESPKYDLILTDLMMPVMDGYQLVEKLKSENTTRHIPVIMLTARADFKDKMKGLRLGVDDYLHKPFVEEELLVRIENLLINQGERKLFLDNMEPANDASEMAEADQEWLESFELYIQKNISDPTLAVPNISNTFLMSESSLLRQLKRLTGLSPAKYIQEVRLESARLLIESGKYKSLSSVADQVGYSDTRSFSRSFKKRYGRLPSDFMNN